MRTSHRAQEVRRLLNRGASIGQAYNSTGYDLVLIAGIHASIRLKAAKRRIRFSAVLKRQRAAGVTVSQLMKDYSLTEEEVRTALGQSRQYIAARKRRSAAIAEFSEQGFSDEQIAAVFGK